MRAPAGLAPFPRCVPDGCAMRYAVPGTYYCARKHLLLWRLNRRNFSVGRCSRRNGCSGRSSSQHHCSCRSDRQGDAVWGNFFWALCPQKVSRWRGARIPGSKVWDWVAPVFRTQKCGTVERPDPRLKSASLGSARIAGSKLLALVAPEYVPHSLLIKRLSLQTAGKSYNNQSDLHIASQSRTAAV